MKQSTISNLSTGGVHLSMEDQMVSIQFNKTSPREHGSDSGQIHFYEQQHAEAPRELRVDQPVHQLTASSRRVRASRVAHAIDACKSSGSRSLKSARISSWLIPELSHSKTFSTGYRRPRMHGFPWQICGETVMRERSSASVIFHRLSELKKIVNSGLSVAPTLFHPRPNPITSKNCDLIDFSYFATRKSTCTRNPVS